MLAPCINTRTDRPCWTCEHFGHAVHPDRRLSPVWCEKNRIVTGRPQDGCCNWQRAAGCDDEDRARQ